MKKKDVPQDIGMTDGVMEIIYAVNQEGRYELVQSAGWEPKKITLNQAWDVIIDEVNDVIKQVKAGKLSPLAFHMAKNQMNISLLAKYVRINRLRIRRHLKPTIFKKLKPSILQKYAVIFGISTDELSIVPDTVNYAFRKENE